LGLTDASRKLIAEFDGLVKKGDTAAEALGKVAKGLNLGDLRSIRDAGAALDALAVRGTISATQVRDAWAQALAGIDLGTFETQARAAFDGSEQGARRLAAAMDAAVGEALRRTGLGVDELRSGFTRAATSATNDFDLLQREIERLGLKGQQVGEVLAASLDRALQAATTERAVQALIDRWRALGDQGIVTGDRLAEGLDRARRKIDELVPGITSIDEAFRALGLRAPAELRRIADANKDAFDRINRDGTVALAATQEAFKRYAQAAIEANNGVASSELRAQAEMLGLAVEADRTGRAVVKAAEDAAAGVDEITRSVGRARTAIAAMAGELSSVSERNRQLTAESEAADRARDSSNARAGAALGGDPFFDLQRRRNEGRLGADDLADAEAVFSNFKDNLTRVQKSRPGTFSIEARADAQVQFNQARLILEDVRRLAAAATGSNGTPSAPLSQSSGTPVYIDLGGRRTTVKVESPGQASALADVFRQLQEDANRVGSSFGG
jgi:hypothetical protein